MRKFSNFTPLAVSLPASVPFVGPETDERNSKKKFKARLGANENGFGASPLAISAMENSIRDVWKYADAESYDLRTALSQHHAISMENIVVGEGIDGLLGLIVRLCVEPGTKVVTSIGAYPTFNYHVAGFGGEIIAVPYVDNKEDLPSLLERAQTENAAMVYFANPDNPLGTVWDAESVEKFARALPETTLLVLDEAYCEMAPVGTTPKADALLDMPNVIRMRTFSKAYALAGLRIGYTIGHTSTIQEFNKVRNHFGLGLIGQVGALAALKDQAHLASTLEKIEKSKARIYEIAAKNGLTAIKSATNFVAIDCHRDADFVQKLAGHMTDSGLFLRVPGVAPLNRYIRISAGQDSDMDVFEHTLINSLKAIG